MLEELRQLARRTTDERAIREAIPRGEGEVEQLASELWRDCTLADHALLRELVAHEIEVRRVDGGCGDGLYALCFLIHTLGQIEDVLLIYQAKLANMDCGVMIDHDLLTRE
jgi:hypothetical protein